MDRAVSRNTKLKNTVYTLVVQNRNQPCDGAMSCLWRGVLVGGKGGGGGGGGPVATGGCDGGGGGG